MNLLRKYRNIIIFILVITMFAITGCSKGSEKKPTGTSNQKPQAPTELKSIAEDLDSLIAELDKNMKSKTLLPMQTNIQLNPQDNAKEDKATSSKSTGEQDKTESSSSSDDKSKEGDSKQAAGDASKSESSDSEKPEETKSKSSSSTSSKSGQTQTAQTDAQWQSYYTKLKNIHTNWNSLMPSAVEAGMSGEARNQFSTVLEQLTQSLSDRNLENSLSNALLLYKQYADMTKIFTNSVPSEFWQVKYEVMTAIFEASLNNWTESQAHIPKMKESWLYLSSQSKDVDSKLLSRCEFSIMDLEQAIQNKKLDSVIIKGEIAMNNLKNLKDAISKQTTQNK